MISRNLRIALLISIGIHVLAMSAVTIINPEISGRSRPYTRVDFLGPILGKTAFDIMIENAEPVFETAYRRVFDLTGGGLRLEVSAPKITAFVQEFPDRYERGLDVSARDFLAGRKEMPEIFPGLGAGDFLAGEWMAAAVPPGPRKIVYKPAAPDIIRGLYGENAVFVVRVKALIGPDGTVIKTEPVTTTGHPRLDLAAAEFVGGWMFEPRENGASGGDWTEVEVRLQAGE